MNDLEEQKDAAARAAASEVCDGMLIGLGTGSTSAYAVREIGRRIKDEALQIKSVATSRSTETLAKSVGIQVLPFENISQVDLTIDGADEIDLRLRAIKGGGGALMREKVVASASKRVIGIVDSSKPVEQLGRFKLPIEVLSFAAAWVEYALKEMGAGVERRTRPDGTPSLTDQGNLIFDVDFGLIADPPLIAAELERVPGILEHGLFLSEIDVAYIGRSTGVEIVNKPMIEDEKYVS